jgi:hypothetical protein
MRPFLPSGLLPEGFPPKPCMQNVWPVVSYITAKVLLVGDRVYVSVFLL